MNSTLPARPETWEIWTYGLASITLIGLISMAGIGLMPLVSKRVYYRCLTLFVGLGVGTLTGSAIFHLIPQAFGLVSSDGSGDHSYLSKSFFIAIGVYLFYFADKLLKIIMQLRKNRAKPSTVHYHSEIDEVVDDTAVYATTTININGGHDSLKPTMNGTMPAPAHGIETAKPSQQQLLIVTPDNGTSDDGDSFQGAHENQAHGICNHDHDIQFEQGDSVIRTVAWMIIFGDGLHNFVDGLSIGAAFSQSLLGGWSIVVAVLCEEFPHELGDVAILVSAGMSLRQAFTYNVLSALTCYLGFAVGVVMGDLPGVSVYIFALAAGMFLYIGLASMIPEMNATLDKQLDKEVWRGLLVFLLQSTGIIVGLALMYFMSLYGGDIQFG